MTQLSNKSSGIQNFARRTSDKVYAASPKACRLAAHSKKTGSQIRRKRRQERDASLGVIDQEHADHFAVASTDHDRTMPAGIYGDGAVHDPGLGPRRQP